MSVRPGEPLEVSFAFAADEIVPVGRLALDGARAVLGYGEQFIASGRRLNPTWPVPSQALVFAENPRTFGALHGVFADSLPDAWGLEIMRRRAAAQGVNYDLLSALDRLALVGNAGVGALVYRPGLSARRPDTVDIDALAVGACAVLEGAPSSVVELLARLGGSSGGARPKVFIARDAAGHTIDGSADIPDGYEAYIVKFRGPADVRDIGPLEAAYADMAREAGIAVSPTTLLEAANGPGYFATRRFDRAAGNRRIHAISVAAALEVDWSEPAIDYKGLIAIVNGITRDHAAAEQMFRRMVFNVFACNRDDHTKQHAFLAHRNGTWTLAPAYDLTLSTGPSGQHYLAVNGKGDGITVDDVLAVAHDAGIKRVRATAIVDEVRSAIARFPNFAKAYGVTTATRASFRHLQAQTCPA